MSALGEVPHWINEVGKGCLKTQLCAIGEGAAHQAAAASARQELAKIFGTKIKAKFQLSTLSNHENTEEWAEIDLQEWVNEMIEGVEITKYHKENDRVYALAVLDRPKAAKRLYHTIRDKDKKMRTYLEDKKRSSFFKLEKLHLNRAALNNRYEFLTGKYIPEKVNFSDILRKRREMSQGILISVFLEEKGPPSIRPLLIEALTKMGFRVVEKNGPYRIQGHYQSEKQFLNIKGFERHRFTLNLRALNPKGEQTGALNFSIEANGRDYTQAHGKALKSMREYLLEHIDDLNINNREMKK